MQDTHREPPDDLDRLFARLEPTPLPPDFARRVLARTASVEQLSPMRARLAVAAYLITLVALGVVAYQAGQGMTLSGAGDLLRLVITDPSILAEEPAGFMMGLADLMPWWELAIALVLAAGALLAVRFAGKDWADWEDLGIR